jgi:parallel beta-helix repeat protein
MGEGSGNNLIGNNMGIEISFAGTENNWIAGNQISGNNQGGITVDNNASQNFLVRNVITDSNPGVLVIQGQSNLLRANSISGNEFAGIEIREGGNLELPSPVINEATSEAISGTACPNCMVEIFSDPKDQGLIYEGFVQADAEGNFVFRQTVTGPKVTATATDLQGNTSPFSEAVPLP